MRKRRNNNLSRFKDKFLKIRNNDFFEVVVISIIIVSAIAVGFRTYEESFNPEVFLYLSYLDYFVTSVFLIEIFIRMGAEKSFSEFFKSPWNIFDFVIVV
jgi:voltage-gated sodium channel